MKIFLIFVSVLLVITAAGSGYYISNLTGQLHDLKTELAGSIAQVNQDLTQNINQNTNQINQINQVDKTLSAQIQDSSQNLTAAINNTGASLNSYEATAGQQFTALQSADAASSGKINDLANKAADTKNQVDTLSGSVLQSSALYDKVKTAIVQISDGSQLWGSGFIVSVTSGSNTYKYVVTAYHVVVNMPAIYMTRYDGLTWKASFFVGSQLSDVAILGFDNADGQQNLDDFKNFPSIPLADSSKVKPGDPVFVVGSPGDGEEGRLGLKDTLTTGVISQVNRGVTIGSIYFTDLLQYDVAVNPGNSGSPLLNASGEVIGLVNARIDPSEGDGIAYAVASNQVKNVCMALPEDPTNMPSEGQAEFSYQYPWSGLTLKDVLPIDIAGNSNTVTAGAKIIAVGNPASSTSLKPGDIIVKLDKREVHSADEFFSYLIENYKVGDTVTIGIMRSGQAVSFALTLTAKS